MNAEDATALLIKLGCDRVKPNNRGDFIASTCFVGGTPVLTDRGVFPIETIAVGTRVLTKGSGFQPVVACHTLEYSGATITVRVRGLNQTFTGTEDHRVFVVRASQAKRCLWKETKRKQRACGQSVGTKTAQFESPIELVALKDLKNGDRVLVPTLPQKSRTLLKLTVSDYSKAFEYLNRYGFKGSPTDSAARFTPLKSTSYELTPTLAFVFGAWLAEGSAAHSGDRPTSLCFTFNLGEPLVTKVRRKLRALFGVPVGTSKIPEHKTERLNVCSVPLAGWFVEMMGRGAENKRIPECVMTASDKVARAFVTAYTQGDGWHTALPDGSAYSSIETVSPHISNQLPVLLARLGLSCRTSTKPGRTDSKGVHHRRSYVVSWSDNQGRALGQRFSGHMTYPVVVTSCPALSVTVHNLTVATEEAYTVGSVAVKNCPLAPWTHKGGIDLHPSFGISIHPGGESKFKCFTCGMDGALVNLLWRIGKETKKDLSELSAEVQSKNVPSATALMSMVDSVQVGWRGVSRDSTGLALAAKTTTKLKEAPPPMPESELSRFSDPPPEVMKYLIEDRRLTPETITKWELKWLEKARRIAIPVRSTTGDLVGISGRAFDKQRPKFLHSSGFRRDFYLYGERFCTRNVTGYLTEGFFDVMWLQQQGVNAFAIMGSYLSGVQVDKILQMFNRIVIVPDGDEPGAEAAARIGDMLSGSIPVSVAPMAEGKDPDELTPAELEALKRL